MQRRNFLRNSGITLLGANLFNPAIIAAHNNGKPKQLKGQLRILFLW
ncbi:MAG: hypothetical protein WDM90_04200 [Ferruginibacter sp.]